MVHYYLDRRALDWRNPTGASLIDDIMLLSLALLSSFCKVKKRHELLLRLQRSAYSTSFC